MQDNFNKYLPPLDATIKEVEFDREILEEHDSGYDEDLIKLLERYIYDKDRNTVV